MLMKRVRRKFEISLHVTIGPFLLLILDAQNQRNLEDLELVPVTKNPIVKLFAFLVLMNNKYFN